MAEHEHTIDEIAPEMREPEAAEKKTARGQVFKPDGVGDFETLAVTAMSDLARPLNLSTKMLRDGGGPVVKFQEGFNMYTVPLRATLRAMGRAKDLMMTGAPATPKQLLADPKLAKRFGKLALDAKADNDAEASMGDFADAMTRMKVGADGLMAGQVMLKAATENYRAVQLKLQRRAKEARRAGMIGEVGAIEHAAEVCARVVEVSAEAVAGAAEIDLAMEGSGDVVEPMDMEAGGTVEDAATEHWSSGQQKAGGAIEAAGGGISRGRAVAGQLQKYALAGKGIELKDVFIVASGDAGKYMQLQKDIAALSEAIGNLEYLEEQQLIHEAQTRLDGFKLDMTVRKETVSSDRKNSRHRAQELATAWAGSTGKSDPGGKDAMFAMYSAEAYQELDIFGTHAEAARRQYVDPHVRGAGKYVADRGDSFESQNLIADGDDLARSVGQAVEAKQYFHEHLPEWQATAEAWRAFLEERTSKQLLDTDGAIEDAASTDG